jgi:hypothetical protein
VVGHAPPHVPNVAQNTCGHAATGQRPILPGPGSCCLRPAPPGASSSWAGGDRQAGVAGAGNRAPRCAELRVGRAAPVSRALGGRRGLQHHPRVRPWLASGCALRRQRCAGTAPSRRCAWPPRVLRKWPMRGLLLALPKAAQSHVVTATAAARSVKPVLQHHAGDRSSLPLLTTRSRVRSCHWEILLQSSEKPKHYINFGRPCRTCGIII